MWNLDRKIRKQKSGHYCLERESKVSIRITYPKKRQYGWQHSKKRRRLQDDSNASRRVKCISLLDEAATRRHYPANFSSLINIL